MIMNMRPLFIAAAFLLASCSNAYFPDTYTYPTGYRYHTVTPISAPHGYDKTPEQEKTVRDENDLNASAWRNAVGQAITPISNQLDMKSPVAVVMDPGLTPLNASAANYTRDMLLKMSYLIGLPTETSQVIKVKAVRSKTAETGVDLTLTLTKGVTILGTGTSSTLVPGQAAEVWRLPGMSAYPAPAMPKQDPAPYKNLNQN